MVEQIDLQKIFSPISSTAKVKEVKRRHTNMQRKSFGRQLREEEEDNKQNKQTGPAIETVEIDDEKEKKTEMLETDDKEDQGPEVKKEPDDNTHGKTIDILA